MDWHAQRFHFHERHDGGELRQEDLDGDLAIVFHLMGQDHRGGGRDPQDGRPGTQLGNAAACFTHAAICASSSSSSS